MSADAITHVVRNFATPGSTVCDPCIGTRAAAKACLLKPKHPKFYECEADGNRVDTMMKSLLKVPESQVLNKKSISKEEQSAEKARRQF